MEEEIFDYSRGIDAPYWIQEIKSPKGGRIFYFSSPKQVSFFVVFFLVLVWMLYFLNGAISWLSRYTLSTAMLLYFVVPFKLAKFYAEGEPQGKKIHVFLIDCFVYFMEFQLDKRSIYQGERLETEKEFVFEKTNL